MQVSGGFPKGVDADTAIQLDINGFKNPIRANLDYNVFTVYTTDEEITYFADVLAAKIRVAQPATLGHVGFNVSSLQKTNVMVVQEVNTMELKFSSPIPLQ